MDHGGISYELITRKDIEINYYYYYYAEGSQEFVFLDGLPKGTSSA